MRTLVAGTLLALSSCSELGPTALVSRDVRWRFPLSSLFFGDPAFDGERIFLVDGERLIAIDKETGAQIWQFRSPDGGIGTEAIPVSDGKIFLYTFQTVYAFDAPTGRELWRTELSEFWSGAFLGGSVSVGADNVYAVAFGGAVYALDKEDGATRWYREISPQPTKGIEVVGLFCIGSDAQDATLPAGLLSCLDRDSGEVVWQRTIESACAGGGVSGHPMVSDGNVIVGDQCGQLLAFDLMTGTPVWSQKYATAFDADLVLDAGLGYACTRTSRCIAFSPDTGELVWQTPLRASAIEAPTLSDGILWVTDLSGSLFQMDASSGAVVVRIDPPTDGATFFSRPIVDSESVYSGGGTFYYALARP